MNILLLAPHPFFANRGTPIAVRAVLEGLSRLGHTVDVLSYHEGEDVDIPGVRHLRIARPPLVKHVPIGPSWQKAVCDAYLLVKAAGLLRASKYDLIHAVEESAFIASTFRLLTGTPFVFDMDSLMSRQIREKSAVLAPVALAFRWLERRAIRRSEGVLAVCPALVDEAMPFHPKGNVALLPDIPMTGGTRGELPDSLTTANRPRLMYVGNLERYQGIDLMLDAFAKLVEDAPEVGGTLVVVGGSDKHIAHYAEVSQKLGIFKRVRFVGSLPVEQLGQVLAEADVLLSPRIMGNNTPMKVYSYLASGRAVIATRLQTHTQVLHDDVARLVAPEADSLAEGMASLLRDEAERDALGARGRAYVESEFSEDAFNRRLADFYGALDTASEQPGDRVVTG